MLTPGPLTRIYLAAGATDLHAGFEKLTILAQALFAQSPTCGHYFLFCNASRTRLKVLRWDGSGLWLCVIRTMIRNKILPAKQAAKSAPWMIADTDLEQSAVQNYAKQAGTGKSAPCDLNTQLLNL